MFLTTPSKEEIIESLNRYLALSVDIETTSYKIIPYIENNHIAIKPVPYEELGFSSIDLSSSAASQMLSRLTIPVMFFFRCPDGLQKDIITHFNLSKEHDYLFRCRKILSAETNAESLLARAVLSSTFTRQYDDHLVFPVVLNSIPENLTIRAFYKYDDITRLEMKLPSSVTYEGSSVLPEVVITNSETGHSSLWIEPAILIDNRYRLASRSHCSNVWNGYRFVHRGRGVTTEKIFESITAAITASQVAALEYLKNSQEEVIPKKAIDFIASIDALPKRYVSMFEQEWQNEQRLSKVLVMKKILEAAEELPIVNQIMIEQAVGSWSRVFEDYNSRITSMAEDMRWLQETNHVLA